TLVTGTDEIAVVDPLLLQELDSGHRSGADEQKDCAAWHFVVSFGQRVSVVWWSIRGTSPYDPVNVDIGQPRESRVSRVHAPDMTTKGHLPPARIVRVIE